MYDSGNSISTIPLDLSQHCSGEIHEQVDFNNSLSYSSLHNFRTILDKTGLGVSVGNN